VIRAREAAHATTMRVMAASTYEATVSVAALVSDVEDRATLAEKEA
jgi:hypothetical protein